MSETLRISVASLAETHALATRLSEYLEPGDVVGLSGSLGSGKTEFVRGIVQSLGFSEGVSSPTFVFEHVYSSEDTGLKISTIHHWDFYRLNEPEFEAEISEQKNSQSSITLIEWPERVPAVVDLLSLQIVIHSSALLSDDPAQVDSALGESVLGERREFEVKSQKSLWDG